MDLHHCSPHTSSVFDLCLLYRHYPTWCDPATDVTRWQAGGLLRSFETRFGSLFCHQDTINAVCFSPDGRRLASASSDGTIKLWDAPHGKQVPWATPRGEAGESAARRSRLLARSAGESPRESVAFALDTLPLASPPPRAREPTVHALGEYAPRIADGHHRGKGEHTLEAEKRPLPPPQPRRCVSHPMAWPGRLSVPPERHSRVHCQESRVTMGELSNDLTALPGAQSSRLPRPAAQVRVIENGHGGLSVWDVSWSGESVFLVSCGADRCVAVSENACASPYVIPPPPDPQTRISGLLPDESPPGVRALATAPGPSVRRPSPDARCPMPSRCGTLWRPYRWSAGSWDTRIT